MNRNIFYQLLTLLLQIYEKIISPAAIKKQKEQTQRKGDQLCVLRQTETMYQI
jgi:hypothetical protein